MRTRSWPISATRSRRSASGPRRLPRYLADERVPSWNNPVAAGKKLVIRYAPIGLVGVIGPWNYPIANSFGDCIPALAAGNSVLLKPSEVTPLSSLLMEEMLLECGAPEGVFQVATGDGGTGAALIEQVDCVMFTGSNRTGKTVLKAAAEQMIPCYLELGGKDPMIVCADADIERAANAAAFYGLNNGGQVCISVERVYVEEPVYDRFVEARHRQRAPAAPGSAGRSRHRRHRRGHVPAAARDRRLARPGRGAEGREGPDRWPQRPGAGRFYEPTVLVDVDHSMKIMQDETFGPTLPIMRVSDVEEGVRLANDSAYGLQASVWTSDTERGEALARRIEAGVVCVNDAQINYTALNLPMGGWKASGLGTRHGAQGIRKYTKVAVAAGHQASAQARAVHVPLPRPPHDDAAAILQALLRPRLAGLIARAWPWPDIVALLGRFGLHRRALGPSAAPAVRDGLQPGRRPGGRGLRRRCPRGRGARSCAAAARRWAAAWPGSRR